ncbi:transposase [Pseudoduganella violaceinigra]|uniref:transposase n=1 Tax=Pseudoduganella violaceinigra TaxID=246602 RepID=UPI000489E048|nr:transposase [Pseudoduganella violaceinigra]
MPRSLRNYPAGTCLHLVQRGNNGQVCFHDDEERRRFLALLKEHSLKSDCDIHAYVLMSNHFHLLVTLRAQNCQASFMKSLAQRTSRWRHVRHGGTGTMWDSRYHSSQIDSAAYLLLCQRYIELNPVRARMVDFAGAYRWSSYRANAEGKEDELLRPHPVYLDLGIDVLGRLRAYRALFDLPFSEKDLERIRFAIKGDATLRSAKNR